MNWSSTKVEYKVGDLKTWKKQVDDLIKYALNKIHQEERLKHIRKYRNLLNLAWSTDPFGLVMTPTIEALPSLIDPVMKSDEEYFYKLKTTDFAELAKDFEDGDEHLSMLPLVQEVWKGLDSRPKVKHKIILYLKSIVVRTVLISRNNEMLATVNKYYKKDKQLSFA